MSWLSTIARLAMSQRSVGPLCFVQGYCIHTGYISVCFFFRYDSAAFVLVFFGTRHFMSHFLLRSAMWVSDQSRHGCLIAQRKGFPLAGLLWSQEKNRRDACFFSLFSIFGCFFLASAPHWSWRWSNDNQQVGAIGLWFVIRLAVQEKPFWTFRELDDMMSLRPSSAIFGHLHQHDVPSVPSDIQSIWCPFGYHLTTGPLVAYFFGPPKNTSGFINFTCELTRLRSGFSTSTEMPGAVFIWGKVPAVGLTVDEFHAILQKRDGLTCSMWDLLPEFLRLRGGL